MAALPQNKPKNYKNANETSDVTNSGFPAPADRPYAKLPKAERRAVDAERMDEISGHGGTNGADKTEGRIRG